MRLDRNEDNIKRMAREMFKVLYNEDSHDAEDALEALYEYVKAFNSTQHWRGEAGIGPVPDSGRGTE